MPYRYIKTHSVQAGYLGRASENIYIMNNKYMTKKQIAAYLAVHPRTIDNMMVRKTIPYTRLSNGIIRFPVELVDKTLEQLTVKQSTMGDITGSMDEPC